MDLEKLDFIVRAAPYALLVVFIFMYFALRGRCKAALTLMKSYCICSRINNVFSSDVCFFYVMFMSERTGKDFYIEYADGIVYLRDMRNRRRCEVNESHIASMLFFLRKWYEGNEAVHDDEGMKRWNFPLRSSLPDYIVEQMERKDLEALMGRLG